MPPVHIDAVAALAAEYAASNAWYRRATDILGALRDCSLRRAIAAQAAVIEAQADADARNFLAELQAPHTYHGVSLQDFI